MSSRLPVFLAALLLLVSCSLDRSVIRGMPGTLEVRPTLACTGDPIDIRWDLQIPAHPAFCRFANGNTAALQSCASTSDCGEAGQCIDGQCNRCALIGDAEQRAHECATPSGAGCLPFMSARIVLTPAAEPPLENAEAIRNEHRGQRQFILDAPTEVAFFSEVIDIDGSRAGRSDALGRFDASRRVERVDPQLTRTLTNSYACQGSPVWVGALLEEVFRVPSATLRLVAVRNPNAFALAVSGLGEPSFTLAPGESRTLNLPVSGRIGARPTPAFLATLPPVQCSAVQDNGRFPDAPLELTVGCPPRLIEPPRSP
ncbi:MAG: hypothetical protein ABWY06_02885 [Pseudomonas sp.]|uniref:hypothetical protein n=1 Tax=Pseudomonas sp. TaxID=306 RepID=UPI003393A046